MQNVLTTLYCRFVCLQTSTSRITGHLVCKILLIRYCAVFSSITLVMPTVPRLILPFLWCIWMRGSISPQPSNENQICLRAIYPLIFLDFWWSSFFWAMWTCPIRWKLLLHRKIHYTPWQSTSWNKQIRYILE